MSDNEDYPSDQEDDPQYNQGEANAEHHRVMMGSANATIRHQQYMNEIVNDTYMMDIYNAALRGSAESRRQVAVDARTRLPHLFYRNPDLFNAAFAEDTFDEVKDQFRLRTEEAFGFVSADTLTKFPGLGGHRRPPPLVLERERRPYGYTPSPPKAPKPEYGDDPVMNRKRRSPQPYAYTPKAGDKKGKGRKYNPDEPGPSKR